MYVRTFNGRVAKLQRQFAEAARQDDHYEILDEREVPVQLGEFLFGRRKLATANAFSLACRQGLIWQKLIGKIHDYVPLAVGEEDIETGAGVGSDSEAAGSEGSREIGSQRLPRGRVDMLSCV